MKLKAFYENKEDIPSGLEDYYVLRAGKYMLEVDGLKTDADLQRVQTALDSEKQAHKQTKEKYAVIADKDPGEIVALLDRVPELEAAAAANTDNAAKVQQMVDAKLAAAKAPLEREIAQLKAKNAAIEQENANFVKDRRNGILEKAILAAAREAGVDPTMEDDVLRYAQAVCDLDDGNNVVTKDGVGVTPGIDPKSLFVDMIQKKPRWFKDSVTAGLGGGKGPAGSTVNPWKKDTWNLTEQGRLVKSDPTVAKNLAKQAGYEINIS